MVNSNEYNSWKSGSQDFLSAMARLHEKNLTCHKCGGILYLTTKGTKPDTVRCSCGENSWNLVKKIDN